MAGPHPVQPAWMNEGTDQGRDRCITGQTQPELELNISFYLIVFSLHLVEGQSTLILGKTFVWRLEEYFKQR